MGSIVTRPPEVEIYYPEGPPMPEGNLQTRRRVELAIALELWFAERGATGAWVCSDINIYYRQGDPTAVVAPDVAVAFGVDADAQEPQNTYRVWDAGAAPCFALEIASPNTVQVDLLVKPDKYAALGVAEYWRLDPTGGDLLDPPLQGETRTSGRWTPIKVTPEGRDGLRARSRALGLDLCWQPPKLRLWDITNHAWLPDHHDINTARETAETRATAAEARAANETAARKTAEARASAAEAEIAELRARLRDTLGKSGQ
jgi:Uma2 family endonuclease